MFKFVIPVLHVSDSTAAVEFYCSRLGFRLEFAHRGDPAQPDPCYMGVVCNGVWMHLSSFSRDGVSGGVVNILVEDVDVLHAELIATGVRIDTGPVDQTWGTREMYVKDADGNCLRFQTEKSAAR